MAINISTFDLIQEEIAHLKEAVKEDKSLLGIIASAEVDSYGNFTLKMEHEYAEKLRGYLTEQLARIGFSKDYALTKDGEIIESLIDKFYLA